MFSGFTVQDEITIKNQTNPYKTISTHGPNFKKDQVPKIVLLATNVINDEHLFSNGLFQNILNLYDLFESIQYVPIILYDKKPDIDKISLIIKHYRYILPETVIKSEIPIYCIIEIGMTCQEEFRKYLCDFGTRFLKLYLGNTLNIDIEVSTRMPQCHFIHHVSGTYDEIYTSPHYNQNRQYIAVVNNIPLIKSNIAPYIWSDQIFTKFAQSESKYNLITWDSSKDWQVRDIVICEPNLGFQKCFYIPLILAANFARKNPEWTGSIKIYNSHNLLATSNFQQNILPLLQIPAERIQTYLRFTILDIIEQNPAAIFIGHQINNEYNYLTLELMSKNFPILHNADGWKKYGYYYNTSSWTTTLEMLEYVIKSHKSNINIYKSHFEALKWTHSPYNPIIQSQWDMILKNDKLDGTLCVT